MRVTGIIGIFGIFKLSKKLCLHRPRGIMGISRILRMLGILKDDSWSKSMGHWNNENIWNYRNIRNIQMVLIDLPLHWQNKEFQVIMSRIFGI